MSSTNPQTLIEGAIASSMILHVPVSKTKIKVGSAVAISKKRAVTALHNMVKINTFVSLKTLGGMS